VQIRPNLRHPRSNSHHFASYFTKKLSHKDRETRKIQMNKIAIIVVAKAAEWMTRLPKPNLKKANMPNNIKAVKIYDKNIAP
jgi:hypothetical protein